MVGIDTWWRTLTRAKQESISGGEAEYWRLRLGDGGVESIIINRASISDG